MDNDRLLGSERSNNPRFQRDRRPHGNIDDVVDVKWAVLTRKRLKALALLGFAALSLAMVAAGVWKLWVEPWRQASMADDAISSFSKQQGEKGATLMAFPEERRLQTIAMVALEREYFDPPQPALAEAALRTAMRRGGQDAALDLGIMYRDGKLGAPNTKAALKLFNDVLSAVEPAARAGESSALIVMGRVFHEGLGVQPDRTKAIEMTLRGAANGSPEQKYRVGQNLLQGWGVFENRGDRDVGLKLIEEAATAGNVDAMETAGLHRFVGKEGDPDRWKNVRAADGARAFDWFVKAAQLGRVSAMANAGDIAWRRGNFADAEKWLEAAHRSGSTEYGAILGLIRLIKASDPISQTAPGVNLLTAHFNLRPFYLDQNSDPDQKWRKWNAHSGFDAAMLGVEFGGGNWRWRERAALTALSWAFVLNHFDLYETHGEIGDYLRTLGAASRARLRSEARLLADIVLASAPGAVSTVARGNLGSDAATRAAVQAPKAPARDTTDSRRASGEPPPQAVSGFMQGAPREALRGRGAYTIDNTLGTSGATVRLYRDGELPAAYSFFVKQGDTFTGNAIAAGSYVMRYRNLGSEDVYEADQQFNFEERVSAEGTSFANVKVTLYPVKSGNMKTKQVAVTKF